MTTHVFRIIVRGAFADLTAAQRAELLDRAAEHDILTSAFTPEGHLTYDIATRPFFTFRFQAEGESADDLAPAVERAEAAARAWLTAHGYGFTNLTSQAQDLAEMPLGKRGRRAARQG